MDKYLLVNRLNEILRKLDHMRDQINDFFFSFKFFIENL